ncbi:MAG: DUF4956 domain-containing protein [Bdellovibrionaceae bacterium]|nr:DUF4956 domain-containing protein [Bdellovibrionales bacterium]MCB9083974.1 DUF4956 domain-containing protein [Pseudobdellovibrionaceae bacterium]
MLDHTVIKSTLLNASLIDILYACMLAFLFGVTIALTYVRTFSGLTYSRAFIQAVIFAPLLTSVAMQAIGDSMARGLGMMGAFSLLRFRTNIKDSRDMMFMFAALASGLACGVYAYQIALVAVVFFCLAVFVVHNIPFSVEADYDAVLRLQVANQPESQKLIDLVLAKYARRFSILSLKDAAQGQRLDLSYQLRMKDSGVQSLIISDLSKINSARDIHLFMQDKAHEV